MFRIFSKKHSSEIPKSERISGKELDRISSAAVMMRNSYIPLEKECAMVDPSHVSIIELIGDGPLLGTEYPSEDKTYRNSVSAKNIHNMRFDEDFIADITPDKRYYRLSGGKDLYLFRIDQSDENMNLRVPKIETDPDARFSADTKYLKDLSDDSEYITFFFDSEGVSASPDDKDSRMCLSKGKYTDGRVMMPSDYICIIPKLTDNAEFSLNTDYPLRARWKGSNHEARMMIAPRIVCD